MILILSPEEQSRGTSPNLDRKFGGGHASCGLRPFLYGPLSLALRSGCASGCGRLFASHAHGRLGRPLCRPRISRRHSTRNVLVFHYLVRIPWRRTLNCSLLGT